MKLLRVLVNCFLFLFSAGVNQTSAQSPQIEWQKKLGGKNGDYCYSIEATSDGGYIAAGFTEGPSEGDIIGYHGNSYNQDIWVVRLNGDGTVRWKKCIGGASLELGAYIHQTSDGGFILAGTGMSKDCEILGNHGAMDYFIVKLNTNGDIIWQKMFGGSLNDYAYAINQTDDGGFIVAGFTESSDGDITANHGARDFWIIKLSGGGDLEWQKSFGGSGDDLAYSMQPASNGSWLVTGYTESSDGEVSGNHGSRDFWVIKISNNGSLQWQKCLGGSSMEEAWSLKSTQDGGCIIAGYTSSNNGDVSGNHNGQFNYRDYWVVKLDATGNLQWQKCYGGNTNDQANFINTTDDGGYVIIGNSESADGDVTCNRGGPDIWAIKISSNGTLEWQKSFGGNNFDEGYSIQQTTNGGFILAGQTCSTDLSGYHLHNSPLGSCGDFWIIKLTAPGTNVPAPSVTISPGNGTICEGVTTTFYASALYAGINPSYQWQINGTVVGGNSPEFTSDILKNGDILTCIVNTTVICEPEIPQQVNASISIKAKKQVITPAITIAADNTILCNCNKINCKASVTNGGTNPIYTWLVNDQNTGISGDVFTSNTLKNGDIIKCSYSDAIACVANRSAYSNSITIIEGFSSAPSVTISASANPICEGSIVKFTASPVNAGSNPSYQWKINGVNTGTNQAEFSTADVKNGDIVTCAIEKDAAFICGPLSTGNSNPITITTIRKITPSVTIAIITDAKCIGDPVSFMATTENAGQNPSYQWTINGVNSGNNSNSFISNSIVNNDVINCLVTSDPTITCIQSTLASSNNIIWKKETPPSPLVTITAADNEVCEGTVINFTATSQNAGSSPTYRWSINNYLAGDNRSVFSTNQLHNGDLISCELIPDQNICTNTTVKSNTIVMAIKPIPAVSIQPADTIVAPGATVRLNTITNATPIASFNWSSPDQLLEPLSLQPSTVPLFDNTSFTLDVKSNEGCSASATAVIHVAKKLIMPNAFSPNGDGTNDIFRIPAGAPLKLTEFSIYDRWGRLLFTTSNISKGWDGTVNGVKVVSGVYAYLIKGTNDNGNVLLKGTVLLIR